MQLIETTQLSRFDFQDLLNLEGYSSSNKRKQFQDMIIFKKIHS